MNPSSPINRYPNVRASVQFLSLQRCQELAANPSPQQRKQRATQIRKLTNDMIHDRFHLNGQAVIVSATGKVLDGMHRVFAAINANRGFWTVLVEGVDDEVFRYIDLVQPRDLTCVLEMSGEKNCSALATTLRRLAEYDADPLCVGSERVITVQEGLDTLAAHPTARESLRHLMGDTKIKSFIHPSRLAWLHTLGMQHNAVAAEQFFDKLSSGTMLADTSPIYALRSRLMAERLRRQEDGRRMVVRDVMALVVKAWNAHVTNATVKHLRIGEGETFPKLVFGATKTAKTAAA